MAKQRVTSTDDKSLSSLLCHEPVVQKDVYSQNVGESNMDNRKNFNRLFCTRNRVVQDGHWAWASLIAAALVQFIVMGIHNSFGNMFQQILKEFKWKESSSGMCKYNFLALRVVARF